MGGREGARLVWRGPETGGERSSWPLCCGGDQVGEAWKLLIQIAKARLARLTA
jgi:hypothetical protein